MSYNYYYYLLYKISPSPNLWIVDEADNKDTLYQRVKNVYSTKDIYYIIKKKLSYNEIDNVLSSEFKRFKLYNQLDNKKSEVVYRSIDKYY
jgi:hypothetical protein